MCLVVLAVEQHPEYPLILAANRDEFHARPTQAAHWWPDLPHVVGGRDLQAGGTWLALSQRARLATVTNFRDAKAPEPGHRSRGHLVTDFVDGNAPPETWLDSVDEDRFAGFNLIVATADQVAYLSNREEGQRTLDAGIYGLSNALLDGPWDKVLRSKRKLRALIDGDEINVPALMRLMNDRNKGPVAEVERGRLAFDTAHAITAPFIVSPKYGTRCTTVVLVGADGKWTFVERRFDPRGATTGESNYSFAA